MECRWSVGESSEISLESLIKLKMIVMSSEISIETLIKVKSGGGVSWRTIGNFHRNPN